MSCLLDDFAEHIRSSGKYKEEDIEIIKNNFAKEFKGSITNRQEPGKLVNHSGGAVGADTLFGLATTLLGGISKHYKTKIIKNRGNTNITAFEHLEGAIMAARASNKLGKEVAKSEAVRDLIIRNWSQVKNADHVYVIGKLLYDEDGNAIKVEGGTGYAVQMAIDTRKPIDVFDPTNSGKGWYSYDYSIGAFIKNEDGKPRPLPKSKNFAGIGTRDLEYKEIKGESGKKTYKADTARIKEYFENSMDGISSFIQMVRGDNKPVRVFNAHSSDKVGRNLSPFYLRVGGTLVEKLFHNKKFEVFDKYLADNKDNITPELFEELSAKVEEAKKKLKDNENAPGFEIKKLQKIDKFSTTSKSENAKKYVEYANKKLDAMLNDWDAKSEEAMRSILLDAFTEHANAKLLDSTKGALITHLASDYSKRSYDEYSRWPLTYANLLMEIRDGLGAATNTSTNSNVVIQDTHYDRDAVAKDIDSIYVFGDNTDDRVNTNHIPKSTQAVIRGLDNAQGIDTKKDRGTDDSSYFTDADFGRYSRYIDKVIDKLNKLKASGKTIVLPKNGIGTGKAMLAKKAPKLYNYLADKLNEFTGTEYMKKVKTDGNYKVAKVDNFLTSSEALVNHFTKLIKSQKINGKPKQFWGKYVAWFGPIGYKYSGKSHDQADMNDKTLLHMARRAEKVNGMPEGYYNSALLNIFPEGKGIGAHTDNEVELRDEDGNIGSIAVVTLGGTSKIDIVDNDTGKVIDSLEATDGSIYTMPAGDFQHKYKHAVGGSDKERISITFRHIPERNIKQSSDGLGATDVDSGYETIDMTKEEVVALEKANNEFIRNNPDVISEGDKFWFDPKDGKITVEAESESKGITREMAAAYTAHEITHFKTLNWIRDPKNSKLVDALRKAVTEAYTTTKENIMNSADGDVRLYERLRYAVESGSDNNKDMAELVAILAAEPNIRKDFMKMFPQEKKGLIGKILDRVKEYLGMHGEVHVGNVIAKVDYITRVNKDTKYKVADKDTSDIIEENISVVEDFERLQC